jgi:hypothetical protein
MAYILHTANSSFENLYKDDLSNLALLPLSEVKAELALLGILLADAASSVLAMVVASNSFSNGCCNKLSNESLFITKIFPVKTINNDSNTTTTTCDFFQKDESSVVLQ